jgi:DNA mismatch endonuclease (patch repair protein)
VVFADGCFFHKCPSCNVNPSSKRDYWEPKLARNVEKDRQADEELRRRGWSVVRLWEHDIKRSPDLVSSQIQQALAAQRV